MVGDNLPLRSASQLATGLACGTFTAQELLLEVLARAQTPAAAGIFITLMPDQALAEARASDARRRQCAPLSPWDGIPIAWKDLFDIEGIVTTAGSAVRHNAAPAERDAALVATCRGLGLICVGKTNLSEFAYSGLGLNPHFGTPRNPGTVLPDRVPGGSSSGSAAAVASGIVPVAVGSDTAGSVRVPAAFCGIWGFKASQSHYPMEGVFPLSSTHDSVGTFANDAADLIQFDALLLGRTAPETTAAALADLSLIIPDTVVFDGIEAGVLERFDAFVEQLVEAGVRIERMNFRPFAEASALFARHGTLTVAEAYALHHELLTSDAAARMDQRVRRRMEAATSFSARDYITLQSARHRLIRETAEMLRGRQMLCPTVAIAAPSIPVMEADDDLFAATNLMALRNTMLGSFLGMPGISIPIGSDPQGLPVGALVSGPLGSDKAIMASGEAMGHLLQSV
jgi:aspartyl-tRNA(Asn)/glutamyl-tRNA(Gln) amidotransferase subunit A